MKNNSKSKLYADDHPELSTKGTGFKNEKIALNTIKIISSRSLKYQFDVVNTMYNRAKYHPNQTHDMLKAMIVFKHWLDKYGKKKEVENKYKDFLSLDVIASYEKLADEYNINDKYKQFLKVYKKIKKPYKLQYILANDKEDYYSYRTNLIKSILQKIKQNNNKLFYTSGKNIGLPTRNHLLLIFHAYSPINLVRNNNY
jgi:hypothetical protein